MGNMSINWLRYSEEEIHIIICLLYQSMDYHVKNLHKSDRANEDGADIIIEKDGKKTAIAIKVKPVTKDRPQVIELANRPEDNKIYIYIQTPTDKFDKFIEEYKDKVDFWDMKKLNDFFRENHPYFMANLIFDTSDIHSDLEKIKYLLFILREKTSKLNKKPIKKMDATSFQILWRLKDVAVALHKTNGAIFPLLRSPMNFKDTKFNERFVEVFLDYLEIMHSNFNLFFNHFMKFYEKNEDLVHNGIIRGITTSHWFWIGAFKPFTNIDNLKGALKKALGDQDLLEKLKKDFPDKKTDENYENELLIQSKGNDVWKAMEYQTSKLEDFGKALEIIIDDIMGEYLDVDLHLFSLENQEFLK